jgi:hypothetical protein
MLKVLLEPEYHKGGADSHPCKITFYVSNFFIRLANSSMPLRPMQILLKALRLQDSFRPNSVKYLFRVSVTKRAPSEQRKKDSVKIREP